MAPVLCDRKHRRLDDLRIAVNQHDIIRVCGKQGICPRQQFKGSVFIAPCVVVRPVTVVHKKNIAERSRDSTATHYGNAKTRQSVWKVSSIHDYLLSSGPSENDP
jgi:hypothetical protein